LSVQLAAGETWKRGGAEGAEVEGASLLLFLLRSSVF